MNTIQGNGTHVIAPGQSSHLIGSTSPANRPQLESEAKPASAAVSPAPILITEKQVVFSTAAAVAVRPTSMRRWPRAIGVVLAVMHGRWMTSRTDSVRPPRYYPKRYAFLEYSCMGREMDRL
jgi:hypothetical protein